MTTLTITRPDDWHVHLRDGEVLKDTVRDISRYNGRALIMPNTIPPVTDTEMALAYKARIMAEQPSEQFEPLMALYLTDNTSQDEIRKAKAAGVVAAKLYPAGATTNSDSGVTSAKNIYSVLEAMEEVGMLLLVHGEVTTHDVDIFDREKEFLDTVLAPIVNDFPNLRSYSSTSRPLMRLSLLKMPTTMLRQRLPHTTYCITATICWLAVSNHTSTVYLF